MFLQGYFYWSGVVANVIVGFWMLVGLIATVCHWRNEIKIRKKYARRNIGGK